MSELTKKQRNALDRLEVSIEAASESWMAAYCKAGGEEGNVVLSPGSHLSLLRNDLVALREKRNALLNKYRDEGRYI